MKKLIVIFLSIFLLASTSWAGFSGYLKADTVVTIQLGPFLDTTDGNTYEGAITLEDTEIFLSKNGGAFAVPNDTNNATVDATVTAYYTKQLDATDTNTEGILTVIGRDAAALVVIQTYQVVNANVYDSLNAAATTDYLQIDMLQLGGVTQSAADLKDLADAGYDPATDKIQSDLIYIHGSALTETAGQLAGSFIKLFDVAAPTATCLSLPDAVPGAAGGVSIAGSNAATTFATLTSTGALTAGSMTITGQLDAGNLLIDSTVAVGTTTTLTGAVSLGSTLGITGATTLASLSVTGQLDAGSVLVDAGMDVVGALSANSLLIDTTTTLTGNVFCAAAFDVVGALSAGSILVDGTTALTGAVTAPAGITANITGNISGSIGTCAAATVSAIGANVITAASIAAAAIDNATFASDVGSTAYASNIIGLATRKALDDYDPSTNTEFELRSLPSADYVVVGDTIAGVTSATLANGAHGGGSATITLSDYSDFQGSAGDQWGTSIPGAYGAGTAGYILGTYLDRAITTAESNVRGADSDTLKALSDQIDTIPGVGDIGDNAVTIMVQEADTTPIADAEVRINNSDESTMVTYGTTDTNGQLVINLDDGTYKVRLRKVGCTFTAPETLTISGTSSDTYEGTQVEIGTPGDSDVCRVYEYCYDQDGTTTLSSVTATAKIISSPHDAYDKLHSAEEVDGTYSASTGLLYWDIVRGAKVRFKITELKMNWPRTVPDAATARLADLSE